VSAARDTAALQAVEQVLAEADEADELLRAVVATLASHYDAPCSIRFVEEGAWIDGPSAGTPTDPATDIPVRYDDDVVAELLVGAPLDDDARRTWERIAELLAPFCLVGWDTGGDSWEP